MKLIAPLAAAALAAFTIVPVLAGPPATAPAKPATKKTPFVCPVTGEKVDDISKADGKSVYKGKTYMFCCAGCKPTFDKNPAKYAAKAEPVKVAPAAKGAKPASKKA